MLKPLTTDRPSADRPRGDPAVLAAPSDPSRAAPPVLDVHDVTVAYHRKPVLWDVDLIISEPRIVGIVGPNGAGKSTLVKAILGLVPMASGRVRILGRPFEKQRRLVGYVPQRESVDWDFPVSALDAVQGIADLAARQIGQLSGGQQQRVFLARALAQRAQIYFMDEPMAGVDAATERVIFDLLRELHGEGKTLVIVHHDLRTVPRYFDDVVLLNMRVVASGPVATTFTPENLRKTYGGRLSILEAAGDALQAGERSL
jgi:manganese/zinc/iron transport system ATP- binding protein